MNRSKGIGRVHGMFAAVFAAATICVAPATSAVSAEASVSGNRWVATWSAAPQAPARGPEDPGSTFDARKSRSFENETIRHIVHTSVGGRRVRVRFSNLFGTQRLQIGAAHVALRNSGPIIHGGGRRLTFAGQASIAIPAGAVAVSDSVELDVPAAADLAVSVYVPSATEPATYHALAVKTSYIAGPGNFVSASDLPGAEETQSTYWLTVVEVLPAERIGTLVALGDSITQGSDVLLDTDHRWSELLSARLNPRFGRARLSVVNQGVGCGRLLFDFCGPSGADRFDRDVIAVTGATHVVVALGLNDIGIPSILPDPIPNFPPFFDQVVSASEIIVGLQQLIQRARAQDIRIYGATITPVGSSVVPGFFTPETEAKRQAVNRWIRTSGAFDGVIDFDLAVRDPATPTQLLPAYNSGDGIHLNEAGHEAMADSINLSMLF